MIHRTDNLMQDVKPFLSKILGMTKLVIARAKSCFVELMKVQEELETVKEERDELKEKNEYLTEKSQELDRENDRLREDSRELAIFRKMLSSDMYREIIHTEKKEEERRR